MGKRGRRQRPRNSGPVPQARTPEVLEPQQRSQVVTVQAEFSGPIPPPSFLREYDEVIPNGAERIMAQFEAESAHRREIEGRHAALQETGVAAAIKDTSRRHWMGAVIAVSSIVGAIAVPLLGGPWQAGAALAAIPACATLQQIFGRRPPPPKETPKK